MEFLKEKSSDRMLFPRPLDGATVDITPPGLAWLPCEGSAGYRVEIKDAAGKVAYGKDVGPDPVHLPDTTLAPGKYSWDVIALDESGKTGARRGSQTFEITKDAPELPWVDPNVLLSRVPEGHSRLLYPRKDLDAIRATLDTTREGAWKACLRAADRALDFEAPEYPTYHTLTDPTEIRMAYTEYFPYFRRHVDGALMNLSLAYLFSEEARYADAAKRILLEIASWPTDDADVSSVSAKWGDEPGLSYSKCAHRAYDWLYHALSDEEKKLVFKMCEDRAWQTHRRMVRQTYLTTPGDSHNGRMIAYLAEMAIVMAGESDGASTWLDFSLKAMTTTYPHWGGVEGGWAEGLPYGLWYNGFYRPAFEALRSLCDYDLWQRPFFRNVRYFFFYCSSVRGEIRPFGDSAEGAGPGTHGGGGYASLMWYHAHRFNDPHVGWWVNQIEGWSGGSGEESLLFETDVPSEPPTELPDARVFRGVGWAGLHSDIADPDGDTFFLFKSSPYGSVSHSHADQNAFAIMKGGHALAIPSGYYGPSYGMPHHAQWTRSTKANNCILVNGEGQVVRDAKANGRITAFDDTPGACYVCGDAANAYMGKLTRFDRHVLLLRPGIILVLDDLEAPDPATYQWMLHAFNEMAIDGRSVMSARGRATLTAHLSATSDLTLSQTDRFDTPYNEGIPERFRKERDNQWHVTAGTTSEAKAARIGAVLVVKGAGERLDVELEEKDGWFGCRAEGDGGRVEGWMNLSARDDVLVKGVDRDGRSIAK